MWEKVHGLLLGINNKLIIQWCVIGSTGCNGNSGTSSTISLPLTLNHVLGYSNACKAEFRQGDWAKCSMVISISVTQAALYLWSFGGWAAQGTKIIIIGI